MITWEYVAGFLDGDGSISVDVRSGDGESQGYKTRQRKIARIRFTQRADSWLVLYKIHDFLKSHGVVSSVYHKKQPTNHAIVATKPAMDLEINALESVEKVLYHILPHLVVKQEVAFRAYRLLQECKAMREKYGKFYRKHLSIAQGDNKE